MNKTLDVYASPLPFSNKQVKLTVPQGATLMEIVSMSLPAQYKDAPIGAVVMINGEVIPRKYWPHVRPKPGNHNIALRVVPMGGGGGKKNPIASLLSIAVLVAAPYISGALLSGTLFATASQGLLAGRLLTAAIGVVGKLAISALAPPPKPSNAGAQNINNPAESPTQFIEGARNSLLPFGVIPMNLGTNRMFPPQAARHYTESQNNDQYVRQLFTYGYGEQIIITDRRIGETPLNQYTDVELEDRLEGDLHEGTTIYTNDVYQEDFSILLTEPDGFITRTTQQQANEAIVDFTFPSGLAFYNDQGKRNALRVQLELQYAQHGVSPQIWSTGLAFVEFGGFSYTPGAVDVDPQVSNTASRMDSVVINKYDGVITAILGDDPMQPPIIPENTIRLANVRVTTTRNPVNGALSTDFTVQDARDASLFGTALEDSNSFVPSKNTGMVVITDGALASNELDITASQKEALRKSVRVTFPTIGQYDIRVRRVTPQYENDQYLESVYLSAIKSVRYASPVNLAGQNGTAMRMKGTDQLNGAVDQYNVIASTVIPDYDEALGDWVNRPSSNPASLYVYVLQSAANAKALPDSKIIWEDFEAWHTYCASKGYTYNRVIDYETSVDEVLRDIASAGAASPAIVDGKRTVAVDMVKDDIVQIITPRNSWGYSGEMIYPELPHAFRVQFRNKNVGYAQDERIVYADGFDETNATKYEVLEIQSCDNPDLAFKNGRRHIAGAILRPELHTWMMDVENIIVLRGNRVKLEHDAPIIGIGDARIKTVVTDGNSPALVTGITVDDTIMIPSESTYYVRIRLSDNTNLYKELIAPVGERKSFNFAVPFTVADAPEPGDLCYFVEAGGEVDLIVTRIDPQQDLTARMTGIDYAQPQIENSENAAIPAFESNITTPLEFIRPLPPLLLDQQSDERVMLVNSDGSFTPRAVFTLQNRNEGNIQTSVKVRVSGTLPWTNADVLESTPERLILTGLDDGMRYDIHIRYRRGGSNQLSPALELNNYQFIGASGLPDDVTGFTIAVIGESGLLKWNANDDIDLLGYRIRFSNVFTGGAWATAQLLEDIVYENRLTVPFLPGTYLIKAVDRSGNESENAAAIITYDIGALPNAVALIEEAPAFSGVKDNTTKIGPSIVLSDTTPGFGYYYFDGSVDLGGVGRSFVYATVIANGTFINNIFDMDDIFAEVDIFGGGSNDIFAMDDIFATEDIFGIGNAAWEVELEFRTTQQDPAGSPVDWSAWQPLVTGFIEFWAIEFRAKLISLEQNISPQVTTLTVKVDMPDRIERGEDLIVSDDGTTVIFEPQFMQTPAVVVTIQDGDAADEVEITDKTPGGFTLRIWNNTLSSYVSRTYDFVASGYGRKTI